MPTVKNWQLGREMSYPYDARHPSRQFAFVFNINRCIACQSCTMACKSTWTFNKGQEHMWWANVETKPYGGYPQWWDAKILGKLEEANPGGQSWSGKPADGRFGPYGKFDGQTVFDAASRAQHVVLLPRTDLQSLLVPGVPRGVSASGHLQTPRGRDCAARSGGVPRIPQVRRGVPLQEDHVPRQHAHERKMYRLL